MAYPTPPAPEPQERQNVQQLSMPIYQTRGWLKFLGVLSIISGVASALSIVGILFAWLPIWMGVLMFQAGSSIESASQLGDKGVLALVGIVFALIMLCITFVLPLIGLTLIPWRQIINNSIY